MSQARPETAHLSQLRVLLEVGFPDIGHLGDGLEFLTDVQGVALIMGNQNGVLLPINLHDERMHVTAVVVERKAQATTAEQQLRQGDAGKRLNWEENTRLKQPFVPGKFMNFKAGSRLEIVDASTVHFVFPEPDGGALAKLSIMHIANRQFYRDFGWGEKHW